MTTDTDKLYDKVEQAKLAYEKAKAEQEAKAQADAEQAKAAETKFFMAQIDSLHEGPAVVNAAWGEFTEAARSGDLPAAYTKWLELEKAKAEQRAWSLLVHRKLDISAVESQKHELRRKLAWAERKKAGLAGRVNRGEGERLAFEKWSLEVAGLEEQLAQLDKLGDNPALPAVPPESDRDFSKALKRALEKVMKNDVAAYLSERTVELRAALKG